MVERQALRYGANRNLEGSNPKLNVCSACFDDSDLRNFIEGYDEESGCSFCGQNDFPTAPFQEVVEHIQDRMLTFYDHAVNQLMYVSAEGGYLGVQYDTDDLLFYRIGLELPRDGDGKLREALLEALGSDEVWCDYSAGGLNLDDAYEADWIGFCHVVKTERRFFFHKQAANAGSVLSEQTAEGVLRDMTHLLESLDRVVIEPAGYVLHRAREERVGCPYLTPCDLGPPPSERAVMSNRMNPPGISMFYAADSPDLAVAEIHPIGSVSIGTFAATRDIQLLDLVNLPAVPGFFSDAPREEVLGIAFLRRFADLISQPVPRDDRSNIEYIPTQVFTKSYEIPR